MIHLPSFMELQVDEETILELESGFLTYKDIVPDVSKGTHTFCGFQTGNLLGLSAVIDKPMYDIINKINNKIEHKLHPTWIHYIEYNNGYQQEHTHENNEDVSFILYMSDDPGMTEIILNPARGKTVYVKAKRGRLVVFNSTFKHKANRSDKKIFVGGLRINDNITI